MALDTSREKQYEQFRSALAQFIEEYMPSRPDVDRYSDEANAVAWAIAEQHAASLWSDMSHE